MSQQPTPRHSPPPGAMRHPATVAPLRPRSRGRRTVLSAALLAGALVVTSALTAATSPRPPHAAGRAGGFLADDGHSEVLVGDQRALWLETARYQGAGFFANNDPLLLFAAGDMRQVQTQTFAIERSHDGETQVETLFRLDDEGVSEVVRVRPQLFEIHTPAVIRVPADAHVGQSWTQTGKVNTTTEDSKAQDYRVEGSIADAGKGCLRFTYRETVGSSTLTTDQVRCPERGLVVDGAFSAARQLPEALSPQRSLRPPKPPQFLDRATITMPIRRGLPMTIEPLFGSINLNDVVVLTSLLSNDLVWTTPSKDGDHALALWVRHPGGGVRSVGGSGDVLVAGTTERQVVAYDLVGRRLWTREMPDVVTDIVTIDENTVVTQTVTGVLTALDLPTGTERWSRDLGRGLSHRPVVSGGRLLAIREAAIVSLDARNGAEQWTASLGTTPKQVAPAAGLLLTQGTDGSVQALDLATGNSRWHRRIDADWIEGLASMGDTVLAVSEDLLRVLRPQDGTVLHSEPAPQGTELITLGEPGTPTRALAVSRKHWQLWQGGRPVGSGAVDNLSLTRELDNCSFGCLTQGNGALVMWGRP